MTVIINLITLNIAGQINCQVCSMPYVHLLICACSTYCDPKAWATSSFVSILSSRELRHSDDHPIQSLSGVCIHHLCLLIAIDYTPRVSSLRSHSSGAHGTLLPASLFGTRIRSLLDSRQLSGLSTFLSLYKASRSTRPADEPKHCCSNMTGLSSGAIKVKS